MLRSRCEVARGCRFVMSNSAGEMAKRDAQACDMERGVPQPQVYDVTRVDHASFDMSRYVSQPSDMSRVPYQSFDMSKSAHQTYDIPRNMGHSYDMNRVPAFDMTRNIPQTFEMSRGVHQSFDMSRGVAQQFDMSRGVNQSFDMQRGATHNYEMPRGPQGYEMPRGAQAFEMPRGTAQPYEMTRAVQQPMEMGRGGMAAGHPYEYGKEYHPCPEVQHSGALKNNHQALHDAQPGMEVPMEMPKTAPQFTAKSKGAPKANSHPFEFAKGYAQQLEVAKKAAQTAIQAKLEAKKAEKAKQEAEQAERAKREAEEAENAKRQAEEEEKSKAGAQPSEILKLYAQQLEMVKKASQSSEIAKMYARQLETARTTSRTKEKTSKGSSYSSGRVRRERAKARTPDKNNGSYTSGATERERKSSSSRTASEKPEDMETDTSDEKQSEEAEGDPPPFEMAKYLAQLSKMKKGGDPPPEMAREDSLESEDGQSDTQQDDAGLSRKSPSPTDASKSTGLPFPFELMKNLGLPLGVGLPGVGSARTKRDRQELTIANKAKLIEQVESRGAKKKADIAREWGLRPSTLSTIMKNKDRILTQYKSQRYAAGRRRMRTAAYPDVEEALLTWFRYARAANIPITGPILQGMGVTLAQELGHPEFSCSVGWLDRFKARHGLTFNPKNSQDSGAGTFNEPENRVPSPVPPVPSEEDSRTENPDSWHLPSMPAVGTTSTVSEEGAPNSWLPSNAASNANATPAAEVQDQLNKWFPPTLSDEHEDDEETGEDAGEDPADAWLRTTIPALLREYKPRDIFSASEAALFYNLLPDRSLVLKGEEGHKWTWMKERLTLLVAANMDGSEKLPLQVIGQMKDPKSIYEIEALPMPYEANESAMMTSGIFELWVRRLEERYRSLNRNIIIILDSCPAHPNLSDLANVRLAFLPQDTASKYQPVEQGVIQKIKALYRRFVLERLIDYNERGREYEITILEAMELLQDAWKDIRSDFIISCFKSAGIEPLKNSDSARSISGEDEQTLLERARRAGLDIPTEVTFESYLNVDSQVQTTIEEGEESPPPHAQLEDDPAESGASLGATFPTEALQAVATLRKFVQEQGGAELFLGSLADLEAWVTKHVVKPEVSFVSD